MHFGYALPCPTMKLAPHAFAPNSQSRCCVANPSNEASPLACLYSAAMASSPKVCASTSKSV